MRIGLICCGYNCEDSLERVLTPFWDLHGKTVGDSKVNFFIFANSVRFQGYPDESEDKTHDIILDLLEEDLIDYARLDRHSEDEEKKVRTEAMKTLLEDGVDYIWQVDLSDEFYTVENVKNIIEFVQQNPFIPWFRVSFRNYVFTKSQYLEEPFTPPRIFKRDYVFGAENISLSHFLDDNDIGYRKENGVVISNRGLPSVTIPPSVALVRHDSWLNNDRSRYKVKYQEKRSGWVCSFKWDETTNSLKFNEEYFRAKNLPIPTVTNEQ